MVLTTKPHDGFCLWDSKVNVGMEFDNIAAVKRAVEANAGVSILPEENIQRELKARHLAQVPFADPAA